MKNLFLLFLALLAHLGTLQAENPPTAKMDKIQTSKEIIVYKTSNPTKGGISRGDTYKRLISIFDKSPKKENEPRTYYEDEMAWKYLYEGAQFDFTRANQVIGFSITSPDYYMMVGKQVIRLGDDISNLSEYFPVSYKNRLE